MLSAIDRDRIEAAVTEAEAGTSGDVVCVLASEVSTYREVPLAWAAAAALIVPPLALALGVRPAVGMFMGGGWTAAQATAVDTEVVLALTAYAVAQAVLFGVVAAVVSIPAVRRALTPRFLKRHRVKKAAFQQFAAAGRHAEGSETGILVFVALDDRQVEILADGAIHEKVGESTWTKAAATIREGMKAADPTDGIVRAIGICGEALKAYFPSDAPAANVLPNRPVEI